MALTDKTDGSRVIEAGINPVKVVLSAAVSASLVAGEKGASGDTITAYRSARISGLTGATIGRPVYLSDTAGGYSESTGTTKQIVGMALSATEILVSPAELNAEPLLPNEAYDTVSADKTLTIADCGTIQVVDTDAKVVTLPATAAGLSYTIMNGGADAGVLVAVSPNAADKISGLSLTPADNKDVLNTKATAKRGDYIQLIADGVDGWVVARANGTWAREA